MRRVLVTGGAGFIGANFLRCLPPEDEVVCLDALTYAGDRENAARGEFVHGDVRDPDAVRRAMEGVTHVVHFAAETHVDRSIVDGADFLSTNVLGTQVLLAAAREAGVERFVQIGTDEVYGDVPAPRTSDEDSPLRPRNPYSASKAAADQLALAHHATYGLPVVVTRCGNNYGPYQLPEKLLPLAISRALRDEPIPVYGDGGQVRDWIFVEDHCRAIALVLERGRPGRVYNVSARGGIENRRLLEMLLDVLGKPRSLLTRVDDRPGHDRRYAPDPGRIERELGFSCRVGLREGLERTVAWYVENDAWRARAEERLSAARRHWLAEAAR